ncbi:MAG: mannitol dehydrogenase family protein [Rhizobiaceae bacterium]
MAASLSLANLPLISDSVVKPSYRREELTPGIIHVGVGNFHRAHQAIYLHRLFQTGRDHNWAIMGAGVKPYDDVMRQRLINQDWLTTVVELDPDGFSAEICASMIGFAEVNARALIAAMSDPEIRIVSLTVTEGGYFVDAKSGGFDVSNGEIAKDIANRETPSTVFGIIIAALANRRQNGIAPFTVMSCDNLPENGHVARQAILGLAGAMSGDMGKWISGNVAFPNGMVDCITPATGEREIDLVRHEFDIVDTAPVVCEPFRQWVLEDNFSNGRPALETVGVEFVNDVAPYELMKLRMLNGGHAAIAYPAALMGIKYAHEAMENKLVGGFYDKLVHDEIMPTVPPIPGVSLEEYYRTLVKRFSNALLGDTIARLCLDGSNRQPKFILPTIKACLDAGIPVRGLALEVALWCRYCAGIDENGSEILIEDIAADRLKAQAMAAKSEPSRFLEMHEIFGSLNEKPIFVDAFSERLNALWRDGTQATLQKYLRS